MGKSNTTSSGIVVQGHLTQQLVCSIFLKYVIAKVITPFIEHKLLKKLPFNILSAPHYIKCYDFVKINCCP